jgi:hypothetical protein
MLRNAGRAPACPLTFVVVVSLVAASVFSGCTGSSQGPRQDELQQAAKGGKQTPAAKVAGHVSIDGQHPDKDTKLFVILNDPAHLEVSKEGPKYFTSCDAEGNFSFTTYLKGDGAPVGKYVVTFAQLHTAKSSGPHGMGRGMISRDYVGPDGLKNLYSDPEKNKDEKEFNIEVAEPGKSDYEFNLSIAGKDSASAGQYAVRRLSQ